MIRFPIRSRKFVLALVLAWTMFAGALCFVLPPSLVVVPISLVSTIPIVLLTSTMIQDCRKEIEGHCQHVEAFISLNATLGPIVPLPQMRGPVISPDLANILATTILLEKPQVVVECGSGVSTIVSSYCLQQNSRGHLWSLDHENKYAEITQENLRAHGVEQYSTVLFSSLKEYSIEGRTHLFYDLTALENIDKIDILFIDGPPRTIDPAVRSPALPLFADKLSTSAIIILDDAARAGERQIVKSWRQQFPDLQCNWIDTEKGAVILRKRG